MRPCERRRLDNACFFAYALARFTIEDPRTLRRAFSLLISNSFISRATFGAVLHVSQKSRSRSISRTSHSRSSGDRRATMLLSLRSVQYAWLARMSRRSIALYNRGRNGNAAVLVVKGRGDGQIAHEFTETRIDCLLVAIVFPQRHLDTLFYPHGSVHHARSSRTMGPTSGGAVTACA